MGLSDARKTDVKAFVFITAFLVMMMMLPGIVDQFEADQQRVQIQQEKVAPEDYDGGLDEGGRDDGRYIPDGRPRRDGDIGRDGYTYGYDRSITDPAY